MSATITEAHRQKPAYVYVRQSTMGQVRHHQESTERQYALRDKALVLGWPERQIRILDGDLGLSGAQSSGREDFKTLVAEVSMGQAGAVFALEASRLARSNLDWHRLLELCALTSTLVIDEDGCYDPADFNDGLLLGLKGTMAQAELHFLRARLQGGKLNKAKRGALHFPLPVGLCYDQEQEGIVLDPDEEVRGAVALVFCLFRETGSAYGVVQHFAAQGLKFPKRAYGGAWDGQLVWGHLTHARVLGVLKNPAYAGVYVFGRYQSCRVLTPEGDVHTRIRRVPEEDWRVRLPDHHAGYIRWEEYVANEQRLAENRTNGEPVPSGPAREGLALLQGLLLCGRCGRRLTVRYTGNGGLYPTYECTWQRRDGLATKNCLTLRCDLLDAAIAEQVLAALEPANIELALEALHQLEERDQVIDRQWQMRLERAAYEAQLAERRYQEVDPANRLVAATLERRWNEALERCEALKQQCIEAQHQRTRVATPEQKAQVLALAQDFPRLWQARTTQPKDRKRMLRLLIKDITVEKRPERQVVLHIRWQGGACTDRTVHLPLPIAERLRYPQHIVARVRELARDRDDTAIAETLNREGYRSAKGKAFSVSMVAWIRYRHRIPKPDLKRPEELTVAQVAERFGVSHHVVYYWLEHHLLEGRRLKAGAPYWITIDRTTERKLSDWVSKSVRIQKPQKTEKLPVGGAL